MANRLLSQTSSSWSYTDRITLLIDDSKPHEAAILADAPISAVNIEGAVKSAISVFSPPLTIPRQGADILGIRFHRITVIVSSTRHSYSACHHHHESANTDDPWHRKWQRRSGKVRCAATRIVGPPPQAHPSGRSAVMSGPILNDLLCSLLLSSQKLSRDRIPQRTSRYFHLPTAHMILQEARLKKSCSRGPNSDRVKSRHRPQLRSPSKAS
ncbi:hypothetical protein V8E53_007638 [Lactarius tabidus]